MYYFNSIFLPFFQRERFKPTRKSSLSTLVMFATSMTLLCMPLVAVNADDKSEKPKGHHKSEKPHGDHKPGKPKGKKSVNHRLYDLLAAQEVGPLDPGPAQDPLKVELGRALFFDWELSGNRDIACATCHHPFHGTGDDLSLPVGTGAVLPGSLGPLRELGTDRHFVPRNAPELFNRGSSDWFSQFWDSRVLDIGGDFINPAGTDLPEGLPNVLAVQAMFPVTSRDEMRGFVGDTTIDNEPNEIAAIDDDQLQEIWDALMDRLLEYEGYQTLFEAAYPTESSSDSLGFEHAAEAIAAFEADAYTFLDSPWDKFLAGQVNALSTSEKKGALLFYGRAKCSECHSGSLMTDQVHYNIGVPQLGPGKGIIPGVDHGLARETGAPEDLYRFRTPPLRNCEVSGPYMHNGAFSDLTEAVAHHASAHSSLLSYDPEKQIDQVEIRDTYDPALQIEVAEGIDDEKLPSDLSKQQIRQIVKFLKTLTAPNIQERMEATIPESVPSGLPIDGF